MTTAQHLKTWIAGQHMSGRLKTCLVLKGVKVFWGTPLSGNPHVVYLCVPATGVFCPGFPHSGGGVLDFKLNSSSRPELFSSPGLLLAHPWSAPRVSLECPTPDCPCNAQPRSVPRVPNPRVSLPSEGGMFEVKELYILHSQFLD